MAPLPHAASPQVFYILIISLAQLLIVNVSYIYINICYEDIVFFFFFFLHSPHATTRTDEQQSTTVVQGSKKNFTLEQCNANGHGTSGTVQETRKRSKTKYVRIYLRGDLISPPFHARAKAKGEAISLSLSPLLNGDSTSKCICHCI